MSGFLMSPDHLTDFEIQKHYLSEPKFNAVYSRGNFSKLKAAQYVINLDDEYDSVRTHWIALYANVDKVTYFNSFGVGYIRKEIKKSQMMKIL